MEKTLRNLSVRKEQERDETVPILAFLRCGFAEHTFQGLVKSLHQPIRLWVVLAGAKSIDVK
jgi:hypothetical protein